jgi:hypothetical protein
VTILRALLTGSGYRPALRAWPKPWLCCGELRQFLQFDRRRAEIGMEEMFR